MAQRLAAGPQPRLGHLPRTTQSWVTHAFHLFVYDDSYTIELGTLLSDDLLKILVQSVKKIPLSILNLPKSDWQNLSSARRGPSDFTVAKPHSQFDGLKNRSLVLMFPELPNEDCAYAGIMRSKQAVTTLDSRIAISSTVKLQPSSRERFS
jgi:hypothetical protein